MSSTCNKNVLPPQQQFQFLLFGALIMMYKDVWICPGTVYSICILPYLKNKISLNPFCMSLFILFSLAAGGKKPAKPWSCVWSYNLSKTETVKFKYESMAQIV